MLKRTGKLKAKKPLNRLSEKRIRQLNEEVTPRILLCKRAGGLPIQQVSVIKLNNGTKIDLSTVTCISGYCECSKIDPRNGCNYSFSPILEPHEIIFRSRGGKLSMSNTIMVNPLHHQRVQNNLPKWSRK